MMKEKLPHFLADTLWFGMTKRISDEEFIEYAKLRQKQGFTAIQIVVGMPPDLGALNENAKSPVGAAWDLEGNINLAYLDHAKKRIEILLEHNLMPIVYGSWGNHIDWMDEHFLCRWWDEVIKALDGYDVIYSLTGEIDLFYDPELACMTLPDKTSGDVTYSFRDLPNDEEIRAERYRKWEYVLEHISEKTNKHIIVHPWVGVSGYPRMKRKDLLSACTFQTGHDEDSYIAMWQNIYNAKRTYPGVPAINLEPWYEGILGRFFTYDMIKAFWLHAASGAYSICYGAHGVWGISDGVFLSNWGKQTFREAIKLESPNLYGKTYKILLDMGVFDWEHSEAELDGEELVAMTRISDDGKQKMKYIIEIKDYKNPEEGRYFDCMKAEFVDELPKEGQVVIFF